MPSEISASRLGALMGVDPRMTRLQLYLSLRGELPKDDGGGAAQEGRYFEEAIFRLAADKFQLIADAVAPKFPVRLLADAGAVKVDWHGLESLEFRWKSAPIVCHPDYWVWEPKPEGPRHRLCNVEVKHTMFGNHGDGNWGDPGSEQVPPHYRLQAMAYQHAAIEHLGLDNATPYSYIAARLIGGVELFRVVVDNPTMQQVGEEARKMLAAVEAGNPPDPVNEEDCKLRWLADAKKRVRVPADVVAELKRLADLSAQRKEIEKQESEIKARILAVAQDASVLEYVDDDLKVREVATLNANRWFNYRRFVEENPGIVAECQKLDLSAVREKHRKVYESYMESPRNTIDQTRVLRVKDLP